MAILELKAARGWSLAQAARAFFLEPDTIAEWLKRIDEDGSSALVQLPEPVNKFPDFVRHIVQRLKALCPSLGKVKIAQMLARAGLHLCATTVGRMLKAKTPTPQPTETSTTQLAADERPRVVTARLPNHVWHADLTLVPIVSGFWTPWLPFALPQCWPFCWWVAVAMDHFSRRVMGMAVWKTSPTSIQVRTFLGRTIALAGAAPKYVICDRGPQFWCDGFKRWCKRRRIRPRFGAIGQHGSIALVERFIRTMKDDFTRWMLLPLRLDAMRTALANYADWFNQFRPHTALHGATPDERYFARLQANRWPRLEPRARWPRLSRCAAPNVPVRGRPGTRLELVVAFHSGSKNLPVIQLKQVA